MRIRNTRIEKWDSFSWFSFIVVIAVAIYITVIITHFIIAVCLLVCNAYSYQIILVRIMRYNFMWPVVCSELLLTNSFYADFLYKWGFALQREKYSHITFIQEFRHLNNANKQTVTRMRKESVLAVQKEHIYARPYDSAWSVITTIKKRAIHVHININLCGILCTYTAALRRVERKKMNEWNSHGIM